MGKGFQAIGKLPPIRELSPTLAVIPLILYILSSLCFFTFPRTKSQILRLGFEGCGQNSLNSFQLITESRAVDGG